MKAHLLLSIKVGMFVLYVAVSTALIVGYASEHHSEQGFVIHH